jgi:ribulose-phosphate 3-epimerase
MCANMLNLGRDLEILERKGMDYLHFDIMDGHFVPSVGLGIFVLQQMTERHSIPVEVHLMVTDPLKYVAPLAAAGASMVTFHQECGEDPYLVLQAIGKLGMRGGLALRPGTPAAVVEPYLGMLSLVLLMAYSPGVGNQAPFPNFAAKVEATVALLDRNGFHAVDVAVDGGVSGEYLKKYRQAGASIFVLGTTGLFVPSSNLDAQVDAVRALIGS